MIYVRKKGQYVQITPKELLNMLRTAKDDISHATGYSDGQLQWGTACDSSDDCSFKMAFVQVAQERFIEQHKKEILAEAAKLVQHDIDTITERDKPEETIEPLKKKIWQVDVTRITRATRTYHAEACEQWAAEEIAIELASNDDWTGGAKDAEYSIETCEPK